MKTFTFLAVAALVSANAYAYYLPEATNNAAFLRIESFDEAIDTNANYRARKLLVAEVDADSPRQFPVLVENRSRQTLEGVLKVWMNDDWQALEPAAECVTLAPGEKRRFMRTAVAKPDRILNALYPVHAVFAAKDEKEPLHGIAVFRARTARPALAPLETPSSDFPPIKGAAADEPSASEWRDREKSAEAAALKAFDEGSDAPAGRWRLEGGRNGKWGAALVTGRRGPVDGVLAITDGKRFVSWRGFACEVNGTDIRNWTEHLKLSVVADRGSLRLRWEMPGVSRSRGGYPRYTKLALGPCSQAVRRAYAGFGNVIENPRNFRLVAEGFILSTRHVGVDYANGLSVVQASDVVPDAFVCACDRGICSLECHHDVTFTLVPSSRGAFAAARSFADVCGYQKGPGVDALLGRQCLDQWRFDYAGTATNIALAAKYGMNDSILVAHRWQRWGYDVRLPDIYPPRGDRADFDLMQKTARDAGILFCLHDNYIDFYPDADGYTYDDIVFNSDGTPQRAWFNIWRMAQSYRFAAHAFMPYLKRNMRLLRDGISPDAIFIDVFSAISPMDYIDREGNFFSKNETSRHWGAAFDSCRSELMRPTAPMISEAGQDHIVGHLDAGQSDHFGAERWMSRHEFDDCERTPWQDIVTHGRFVLFAGGIAGRYAAPQWHETPDLVNHGYATDDYLGNTIIGGRNPMSDGKFCRATVLTYWLLHDACASLARADFDALDFCGNIHRQHSSFSNGGEVWVNRATNATWSVAGVVLPRYGFLARVPGVEVGVVEKNGHAVGYSRRDGIWFVDARGKHADFGGMSTDGSFRFEFVNPFLWRIVPLPESAGFSMRIDLAAFGAKGKKIVAVRPVESMKDAAPIGWSQKGDRLEMSADARAFAYEIVLE